MKILLINHYAGSPEYGMEFRPYYMCKEWLKFGHKVLIVGGSQSHLRKQQPQKEHENIDGVDYSWVKLYKYKGNGIGRIISMGMFISKLGMNYKKYLRDFVPDIVIASSTYPLDIYPARRIAKHYGAKLIYEVHDLWPLSPIELGGYSPKHPFIRVMQKAEDDCYKYVDAVVSMLPKSEPHMKERGLADGKFFCVPNGIVMDDWMNYPALSEPHLSTLDTLHSEGKFVVGFAGAHGIANSLYAAIDAVSGLKNDNVVFVLVGTGPEKERLIAYTKQHQIENVLFLPPVNKKLIPSLLEHMDALYIGLQRQSLFRFGISPNKMFDYMMASKPIIQAIDAGNNLVEEAQCGLYAEPDNIEEIRNAILQLKNMSPEERTRLGGNGKDFVMRNHTYGVLAQKFIDVMAGLLKS